MVVPAIDMVIYLGLIPNYMFVGATNTLAMGIHFHSSLPSSIPVYKKVDNVSVFRCFAFLFFFGGSKDQANIGVW